MKKLLLFTFCLVTLTGFSQIQLLYDFQGTVSGSPGANDKKNVFIYDDYLYFPAYAGFNEIWRTNGSIVEPLRDNVSSFTRYFMTNPKFVSTTYVSDPTLSFVATKGTSGSGASGNTFLVSGRNTTNFNNNGTLQNSVEGLIANVGNDIFFVDGGIIRKKEEFGNLFSYSIPLNNNFFQNFRSLVAFNGKLYFGAENTNSGLGIELYELNLSTNTYRLISDIANGTSSGIPENFFEANGKLYFTAKTAANPAPYSLFVYNPNTDTVAQIANTESPEDMTLFTVGTNTFIMLSAEVNGVRRLVRVLTSNDSSIVMSTAISDPVDMIAFNGSVYFGATGANGFELYKTSQIPGGETLVADINTSGDSSPRDFLEHLGELYFRANDGTNGQELWKVDTNDNATMVDNFVVGSGNFSPIPLASLNGKLYMSAIVASSNERELFTYNNLTTFTGAISSDWDNANNWSNGIPNSNTSAIIPSGTSVAIGNYATNVFSTNAICLDLTVEGSLTVDAGSSLTIQGDIDQINGGTVTVNSEYSKTPANNKTGTLLLQGSQNGDLVTFNRSVRGESSGGNHNWSLISFGLREVDITALISNNNFAVNSNSRISLAYYNNFQANTGWIYYTTTSAGTINNATGFAYSPGVSALSDKISFSGKLRFQDASLSVNLGANNNNWNLVGNPFLGFMPINDVANSTNNLLLENDALLETGFKAAYIWDSTLNNDNGGYKIVNQSTPLSDSFLAPGQGFFIRVGTNGSFNFSRDLRTHQPDVLFYKTTNQPKITLQISQNGKVNSTEVKYLSNTGLAFEDGFDAGKFNGEAEDVSIFTEIPNSSQGIRLGLQCVSQDYENISIPIGTKVAANQEMIITANVSDLPTGVMVYLEDKILNTFTRLDNGGEYKYTPISAMDNSGRFYLRTSSQTLTTEDVNQLETVNIYQQYRTLKIVGLVGVEDATVKLYNLLGQEVLQKTIDGKNITENIQLPTSIRKGVYIVNVESRTNKVSKKIILN